MLEPPFPCSLSGTVSPEASTLEQFVLAMREIHPGPEYFPIAEGPVARCLRAVYPVGIHVDWIAPRYRWQVQMLERAPLILVGGTAIPVIDVIDLIVMKLKAGGQTWSSASRRRLIGLVWIVKRLV